MHNMEIAPVSTHLLKFSEENWGYARFIIISLFIEYIAFTTV